MKRRIALVCALAAGLAAACGAPAGSIDSDGDGLDDAYESELGTSPQLPDTDGDGFSDFQEVIELGFAPASDPTRFNPLVADVPELRVDFARAPRVYIRHTDASNRTRTFDSSTSDGETRGFTTSRTDGQSTRTELASMSSFTHGQNFSLFSPGLENTYAWSDTETHGSEQSVQWSQTHSRENSRTLSESRGFQQANEIQKSSGEIEVVADLHNRGHIAFTLRNLALGARKLDDQGRHLADVGQLELDTRRSFFDVSTLKPGESLESLIFIKDDLNLEKAEQLLEDGALLVRPVHYELVDIHGVSFDHRFTEIAARTATLIIDAGAGDPEIYRVATANGDGTPLSLAVALRDVLRIPFRTGSTIWKHADGVGRTRETFLSLAGVATDSASGSFWVLTRSTAGDGPERQVHHALRDDLDLDEVRLRAGDELRLVHVVDADRDGLGERAEFLYGTDPALADTDGDGMGDGAEVEAGRHPGIDEDYPGVVVAGVEVIEQEVSLSLETELRGGARLAALQIDWGDGTGPEVIREPERTLERPHRYARPGSYTIALSPRPGPDRVGRTVQARASVVPELVPGWTQQLGLAGQTVAPGSMVVGMGGDVFVAGESRDERNGYVSSSLTGDALASRGNIFLVKYDPEGHREWVAQFGVRVRLVQLAADPQGGVQLLYVNDPPNERGAAVRRYAPNGKLVGEWPLNVRKLGLPAGFALDAKGDVYLASSDGKPDMFVTKLVGPRRQVAWRKRVGAGTGAHAGGRPPLVDSRGFVTLATYGGDLVAALGGKAASWTELTQLDPNGELRWRRKLLEVDGAALVTYITIDDSDHLTLGGITTTRLDGATYRGGGSDGFVTRVSPDGEPIWTRRFATYGADAVHALAAGPDRVYVFGNTQGILEDDTADVPRDAPARGFLASFDAEGRRRFLTYTATGRGATLHPVMARDVGGAVYVSAGADAPVKEGWQQRGVRDLFVARYARAAGNGDASLEARRH